MRTYRIAFAILLFAAPFLAQAQTTDKPNILWIVSEDNSPFIGAYGDTFATTPNIDKLATQGVLYTNAFATAPVCAPSRSTLITGMYPPSMGTENMRSTYPAPDFVKFYPKYLREAGYYTSNNVKKDYNVDQDQEDAWDESSHDATYQKRKPGQPFFAIFNTTISHESCVHKSIPNDQLRHSPAKVPLPPYHPDTPEMRHDWAQYYDKVEDMDTFVGKILADLEASGEAENTIVFYYSDHGGVLGRSKRFMYESGLHIPLVIRFPKKYAHLAPGQPGTKTDRIVTFLDFAPSLLSLAGVPIPEYMGGKAFLGTQNASEREYAHAFRGRMDERIDLVRSVRDKKYRYIRNYMPHKIYGQYIEYLWRAPSMGSWEAAYKAGTLNDVQKKFWETKPVEELFDVEADPHNVNNLAGDPKYAVLLKKMRQANHDYLVEIKDVGFLPEGRMEEISQTTPLFDYARSGKYDVKKVIETAEMASMGDPRNLKELTKKLTDGDPVIRYWAATGCTILGNKAQSAKGTLINLLSDPEVTVRIAAAEALTKLGEKEKAVQTLTEALNSDIQMARVQALNVLEQLGPEASKAFPAVKQLIDHKKKNADYDLRAAEKILASAGK
ncbi:sulfatase-like hydrolase/transferase [Persicitalea jodogahamensis]|uniref:Sulfatase n=1 Tax=Persicitalea jodogahamensis TaxID=402147 RepID=A0A8J3G8J6_9BACT|nr:sulfatase-like hydrolase/transferase [Persicitalea jodogahamensis]GHB65373.1 sulfatase [Persicitalea jodogahamensis]